MGTEPDKAGLDAARQVAQWELGSSYWADRLISAYLDPETALRILEAAKGAKRRSEERARRNLGER